MLDRYKSNKVNSQKYVILNENGKMKPNISKVMSVILYLVKHFINCENQRKVDPERIVHERRVLIAIGSLIHYFLTPVVPVRTIEHKVAEGYVADLCVVCGRLID